MFLLDVSNENNEISLDIHMLELLNQGIRIELLFSCSLDLNIIISFSYSYCLGEAGPCCLLLKYYI